MRKIKFRAKRIDGLGWVEGYVLETPLTAEVIAPVEDGHYFLTGNRRDCISKDGCVHEIDFATLGQFTGLIDKNGTEIYEGDIVRADMDFGPGGMAEQIASIYWDEGVGGWQFNYFDKSTIEIIGNIFEHKYLLEGEKND